MKLFLSPFLFLLAGHGAMAQTFDTLGDAEIMIDCTAGLANVDINGCFDDGDARGSEIRDVAKYELAFKNEVENPDALVTTADLDDSPSRKLRGGGGDDQEHRELSCPYQCCFDQNCSQKYVCTLYPGCPNYRRMMEKLAAADDRRRKLPTTTTTSYVLVEGDENVDLETFLPGLSAAAHACLSQAQCTVTSKHPCYSTTP